MSDVSDSCPLISWNLCLRLPSPWHLSLLIEDPFRLRETSNSHETNPPQVSVVYLAARFSSEQDICTDVEATLNACKVPHYLYSNQVSPLCFIPTTLILIICRSAAEGRQVDQLMLQGQRGRREEAGMGVLER